MAKLCDLKDDLTGELGSVGSRGNGSRTGSDQYMQAMNMSAQMPSMNGPSGFAGSPIPAQPPTQLAMAPQAPQRQMPPPMDASASMVQAQQRVAMESDVMRPPYTQPYGPMAYATQPGFQGAPVSALQMPVYAANDSCTSYGAPPRMTPAAQMQLLQQQRLAQLQAQSQAVQAQQMQAQAGQACLKGKKMKKMNGMMAGVVGAGAGGDCGKQKMWINLIWALVVLIVLALMIAAVVIAVKSYKYSQRIASTLSSPIVGA